MAARSKKKRSFFPEGFDEFLRLRAREGGGIVFGDGISSPRMPGAARRALSMRRSLS